MNSQINRLHIRDAGTIFLGFTLFILAHPAGAQPVDVPPTWGGSFTDRPRLTGNWGGLRDEMGKKGVVLDIDLTQGVGGVVSGGRNDGDAQYGGLAEYTLHLDTQKMGLWPGGFLNVQGMTNYEDNVNFDSGAFIPPDFAGILPEGKDVSGLMSLMFMQFFSTKFGVFAGKISGLAADDNAFAHNYHTQFMNTGLNLNMALDLFPFTSFGGGLVFLPWEGAVFTASAIDPHGSATNNDIGDAFEDGVVAGGEGRITIKPSGLVGHQTLGVAWSNADRLSLRQDPFNVARLLLTENFPRLGEIIDHLLEINGITPPPVVPLNTEDSTWAVYYNFDQYLWSPAGQPDEGIGIFFRFGAADKDTSPVQYTYNFGIGGKGIVPGRPFDSFGIGWSRVEISDDFVSFLRDKFDLGLDHEDAVEMYYNASLTRWLDAAFDVQVIDSALNKTLDSSTLKLDDMDTSVVLGLRVYARF